MLNGGPPWPSGRRSLAACAVLCRARNGPIGVVRGDGLVPDRGDPELGEPARGDHTIGTSGPPLVTAGIGIRSGSEALGRRVHRSTARN
mgnify:CR=1 FL=1